MASYGILKIGMTEQEAIKALERFKISKPEGFSEKLYNGITNTSQNAIRLWFNMDSNGVIDNEEELKSINCLFDPLQDAEDKAHEFSEKIYDSTHSNVASGTVGYFTFLGKIIGNFAKVGAYSIGGMFTK